MAVTIVTRGTVLGNTGKGTPLTQTELDTNFMNLKNAVEAVSLTSIAQGDSAVSVTDSGANAGKIELKTDNTVKFTINTNGALGIGSTPDYGTTGQVLTSNASTGAVSWATPVTNALTQDNSAVTVTDTGTNGKVVIKTEGADRVTVDSTSLTSNLRVGSTTTTAFNLASTGNVGTWIGGIQDGTSNWSLSQASIGFKADDSSYAAIGIATGTGLLYFGRTTASGAGTMTSWLEVSNAGVANFKLARPQYNGSNLALVSDLSSYLQSESDTLATVTGRGATTSTAVSLNGGVGLGDSWISFNDTNRDASATVYAPNSQTRSVRFAFINASSAGTGGNYAGMLQINPWTGTTVSTGDASYQLAFGSTEANASGVPQLRIRKGIDTTWNSWYTIYHAGNLTNLNQLTNGPGYLTAESDTLATVTTRGSTTNGSISVPAGDGYGYSFWGDTTNYKIHMGNSAAYHYGPVTDYSIKMQMDATAGRGFTWGATGKSAIAGLNALTGDMTIAGAFAAASKSFLIPHPTKKGMKLRYGSLEGPENGVYVRGRLKDQSTIELPDYWTKLVDPDSITVSLTPVGKHQKLYVQDIRDNKVYIANDGLFAGEIDCFYTVYGERVDIEKLVVEY